MKHIILTNLTIFVKGVIIKKMAKKAKAAVRLTGSGISQLLIVLTVIIVLTASYQAATQNDITGVAPTQLFLVAGVLGILGLYLKDEK